MQTDQCRMGGLSLLPRTWTADSQPRLLLLDDQMGIHLAQHITTFIASEIPAIKPLTAPTILITNTSTACNLKTPCDISFAGIRDFKARTVAIVLPFVTLTVALACLAFVNENAAFGVDG